MTETATLWKEQPSPFEYDDYKPSPLCADSITPVILGPLGDLMSVFFAAASFRSAGPTPPPKSKKLTTNDRDIASSLRLMMSSCCESHTSIVDRGHADKIRPDPPGRSDSRFTRQGPSIASSSAKESIPNPIATTIHSSKAKSSSFDSGVSFGSTIPVVGREKRRRVAVPVMETLRDAEGRQVVITSSRARRPRHYSSGDASQMRKDETRQVPASISWNS